MKNILKGLLLFSTIGTLHAAGADELPRLTPGARSAWDAFKRERTELAASVKSFPENQETKTALGVHAFYATELSQLQELHKAGADFLGARKKAIHIVHKGAPEDPETEWSPMHAAAYYACVFDTPVEYIRESLKMMLFLSGSGRVPLNQTVGGITTKAIVNKYSRSFYYSPVQKLLREYDQMDRISFSLCTGRTSLVLKETVFCGIQGVPFDSCAFYSE